MIYGVYKEEKIVTKNSHCSEPNEENKQFFHYCSEELGYTNGKFVHRVRMYIIAKTGGILKEGMK
jgi:hypothetical protein